MLAHKEKDMKRIIDGVTYNTDTATLIARSDDSDDRESREMQLYQTRGGAFFVVVTTTTRHKSFRTGEWEENTHTEFEPMTRDGAEHWVLTGQTEVLNNVFDDPPEAEAEATPGATLYIRVPASLKDRIEARAKEEGLSVNAWTIRCVERCCATASRAET